MSDKKPKLPPQGYAIGGCFMLGLGAGFFFFPHWIFSFIGCMIIGTGVGLVLAAFLSLRSTEGT